MSEGHAPFFDEVAHGPATVRAFWTESTDRIRLRIAHWPLEGAKGTVLIFPGRTEFVEKYGRIAKAMAERGLASAAIDWRGQGMSERLLDNPLIGHVERFTDYQKDVAAFARLARAQNFPRPWYLIAHSMGGAIGLRALLEGLEVQASVFSGPMWGLQMEPHIRPAAWLLSLTLPQIGQGHRLPPGTQLEHHVLVDGFEKNLLTNDREQFDIMRQQLLRYPDLSLGGPSFVWLREALLEIRALARQPSPENMPCLTYVGSNEQIVSIDPIRNRMARWPAGTLEIVPEGRHEVLMDSAIVSEPLFDSIAGHFRGAERA